jgi:hypothetical protein
MQFCAMSTSLNKHRLKNLLRSIQTSLATFESQGHPNVYFTAQFLRDGRRQNGIERGDPATFSKQLRTYIMSEDADSARIEFIDELSGKTIYSKALTDLRKPEIKFEPGKHQAVSPAVNRYAGLGEAEIAQLVDKRVTERQQQDEFIRLGKEVNELRAKNEQLTEVNYDLEAKIHLKSQLEFYSGIIGTAFPGIAAMLSGTPLAQAASFLAGAQSATIKAPDDNGGDKCIAAMIAEFCQTLNEQELSAIELLFIALEKDKTRIQNVLQFVTAESRTAA